MKTTPLILLVSVFLVGCSLSKSSVGPRPSYPDAYMQALISFPGAADVQPQVIDAFVEFLSRLGADDTAAKAQQLYAERLHFSDALMLTSSRAKVVEHFQGLVDNGAKVDVDMLQVLVDQADVYLVWAMTAEFQPINKPVTSKTIGITHLRFDRNGHVVLHQDFWDTGLGFYQHIPVLGGVIKSINKRFVVEDGTQ